MYEKKSTRKLDNLIFRLVYRVFWDTGYWPIFLRDTGIFVFFILGYGIFRNFGIWDIGIYFGIRVKLILGYWIYWTVYFWIWDIAYPPNQASDIGMRFCIT